MYVFVFTKMSIFVGEKNIYILKNVKRKTLQSQINNQTVGSNSTAAVLIFVKSYHRMTHTNFIENKRNQLPTENINSTVCKSIQYYHIEIFMLINPIASEKYA